MMSRLAGNRKGFTLIVMLVVIVVIAIFSLVISRLQSTSRHAMTTEDRLMGQLQSLQTAIDQFYGAHGDFPKILSQLVCQPTADWSGNLGVQFGGNGKVLRNLDGWMGYHDPETGAFLREIPESRLFEFDFDTNGGNTGYGWNYSSDTGKIAYAATMENESGERWCDVNAERIDFVPPLEDEAIMGTLSRLPERVRTGDNVREERWDPFRFVSWSAKPVARDDLQEATP